MQDLYTFNKIQNTKTDFLQDQDLHKHLGSKGYKLLELKLLNINVPNFFIIPSCFYNKSLPINQIIQEYENLKSNSKKSFFLVSVRSGSKVSMPGMMDTVLNLGINDSVYEQIKQVTNDNNFAKELYVKFLSMYSLIVLKINKKEVEKALLPEDKISSLKNLILKSTGKEFDQDPKVQLQKAIMAVFDSWNNERACVYRKMNNIPDDIGTAIIVQEMVYGNLNVNSSTGVLFTRNPTNGTKELYGEFLIKAQGEDLVDGSTTPTSINNIENTKLYKDLQKLSENLEFYYKDMQDIEFTVENSELYILQTRSGKRSSKASVKIAVDLYKEQLISKQEALLLVDDSVFDKVLYKNLVIDSKVPIANGIGASLGASFGRLALSLSSAELYKSQGDCVIFVSDETSAEDIKAITIADGVITNKGGATSHAAVVTRAMGKPCVTGVCSIVFKEGMISIGSTEIIEGEYVSIDGLLGYIFNEKLELTESSFFKECYELLEIANEVKKIQVRANAETKLDAEVAYKFGADGIGLVRTEHMFFEGSKINFLRLALLSKDFDQKQYALHKLFEMQKNDFIHLFKITKNTNVNIRLLDPPIHEFLPKNDTEYEEFEEYIKIPKCEIINLCNSFKEHNPMIGHRGVRLGLTDVEIYKMQIRSIFEAAKFVKSHFDFEPKLEIMIAFVSDAKEIEIYKRIIESIKKEYTTDCKIGVMIELPRACLVANEIAIHADYFSFGTNDLTQTVYGMSRDDTASYMDDYKSLRILKQDPFQTIDKQGVGFLIERAISLGVASNKNLTTGVCGEHGGDIESVKYFSKLGLNYISCSPYRVPTVILTLAKLEK